MKKILVIDGGGAKGVIPLTVIKNIEKHTEKCVSDTFDLIVGSSIGAIIGTILTITDLKAVYLISDFKEALRETFKKRFRIPVIQPKYSRKPPSNYLEEYIGGSKLNMARTKLMFTSVNMVDGRTHFFKSWEEKDGKLNAIEAVNRSYAAPLYFGTIKDKKDNAVWLDGGTSNNSCPLVESYIEAMRQGWVGKEKIHIISLGCGSASYAVPYKKASKYNNIRQVYYYMDPVEGGLARVVAADTQSEWLKKLSDLVPDISFQRIEKHNLDPKIDGMDKVEYLEEYQAIGEQLSKKVNYDILKNKPDKL